MTKRPVPKRPTKRTLKLNKVPSPKTPQELLNEAQSRFHASAHPSGRTPLLEFTAPILSLMQEILVERKGSYGDLADNTQRWIDMLRIMGFKFPKEFDDQTCAAIMHITMKLTRMPDSPHHRDNWLDLSNYGVLGLAMLDRKAQEKD